MKCEPKLQSRNIVEPKQWCMSLEIEMKSWDIEVIEVVWCLHMMKQIVLMILSTKGGPREGKQRALALFEEVK